MKTEREKLVEAVRCCIEEGGCNWCPLQGEICDQLKVDMESLPAELVDMIEEELEEK